MPRGKKKLPNRVRIVFDTSRAAEAAKKQLFDAVRAGDLTEEELHDFELVKQLTSNQNNGKPRTEEPSSEPLEAIKNGQIASTI